MSNLEIPQPEESADSQKGSGLKRLPREKDPATIAAERTGAITKCRECGHDVYEGETFCSNCDELNYNSTTFRELGAAIRRKREND